MDEFFKAVRISEHVYWVGAIDWNVRNFHGYTTGRGTTYNAFLIIDEKVTLIDTVKAPFYDELMARIRSVIDPAKIDYIVSNHAEMDHSGSLPAVIEAVRPEKVFASPMGEKGLKAHFGADLDLTVVKTGDTLSLGRETLHFVETKMLHWPDSMITYLEKAKILFSQDAFGMHLAGSNLYTEEYDRSITEHEAKKYFANILLHLSPRIIELLDVLPSLKLDISMIAPDHGPIHRTPEDIGWILKLYREMAEQKPKPKALVFYATMWDSTEKIGRALADGLAQSGVEVKVASLNATDRSAIITDILDCGLVAAGTPTMNNNMFPAMADALTYIKGLRPRNRIGFAFGSYGWSGEGGKQVHAALTEMGFEMPMELMNVKYVPTAADLEKAFDAGVALAKQLIEKTK